MHYRGLEVTISPGGVAGNAPKVKDPRDLEVVREFQRGTCRNKRDAVDSIPLLAINHRSRVCKRDCSAGCDQSIVVGALGVRPRPACCQVPTDLIENEHKKTSDFI